MTKKIISVERLNDILKSTIDSIASSKDEIIEIVDYSLDECKKLEEELKVLQVRVSQVILDVERLELIDRNSRNNLSRKNQKFELFDEESMRQAYDIANEARVKLLLKMEEEKNLRERREETEIRLKSAYNVYEKAGKISTQINVASEYLMGSAGDISETMDELSQKHYLGIRIMEAQEEERHRLARDIHDGPAQSIANIILKAELCERLMVLNQEKASNELKSLKEIARETLKEVRKTIYDLRPMSLEDLGLIPTLERYIDIFEEDSNINVGLKTYGAFNNLESVLHIGIFRIVQESLSNIRKHSGANSASVIIERSQTKLNLSIIDDGVGFDPENYRKDLNPIEGGFGIINIKERVQLLNGNIQITSSRKLGTKISVFIPLKEEE